MGISPPASWAVKRRVDSKLDSIRGTDVFYWKEFNIITMTDKPSIEDIKYIGSMMGQKAWGNDDAIKIIDWYKNQLIKEMKKNLELETDNFRLECNNIRLSKQTFFQKLFN
jgi:hypothetical protein